MTLEIFADSRGPDVCRSCGATIEWAEVVTSGARMPFEGGIVVRAVQPSLIDGGRTIETVDTDDSPVHWMTCPHADTWRRRKVAADRRERQS